MTPQEMQLEVMLGLQKVNSSFYDEFNPEEIDAALNKAQLKFVNQRFLRITDSIGFEQIQKRLDDVRGLIIRDRALTPLQLDSESQYGMLPPDYLYLINDISTVDYYCDGLTKTTTDYPEYIAKAEIKDATGSSDFYDELTFVYDYGGADTTLFDMQTFSNTGFESIEEKYRVIDLFLEVMADLYRQGTVTFQTYFERYQDQYEKNHFFFVSYNANDNTKVVRFDDTDSNDSGTFTAVSPAPQEVDHSTTTNLISQRSVNRLTETEKLFWVLDNPFGKTSYVSPISSIDEQRIVVYSNETFILKGLKISYIRKPNKISLLLNRSCELAEHTHPEIVDNAVSNLLERVEAARYQTSKIEEKLNE